MLEKTAQPFLQPIYDFASPQMAFERVALIGDAAFLARPHVGMGVTKAAEDALALTDCIATYGATPQALQAFEQMRLAPCTAVVERGRVLGAYLQARGTIAPAASQQFERDAHSIMMQTAIDLSAEPTASAVKMTMSPAQISINSAT